MTTHLPKAAAAAMRWLSSSEEGGESFGVHIEYVDLYDTVLFFAAIYMAGQIAAFIKMPSLVGEIICGILLGPPLADFVPNPEAFVMLGEIGVRISNQRYHLLLLLSLLLLSLLWYGLVVTRSRSRRAGLAHLPHSFIAFMMITLKIYAARFVGRGSRN